MQILVFQNVSRYRYKIPQKYLRYMYYFRYCLALGRRSLFNACNIAWQNCKLHQILKHGNCATRRCYKVLPSKKHSNIFNHHQQQKHRQSEHTCRFMCFHVVGPLPIREKNNFGIVGTAQLYLH